VVQEEEARKRLKIILREEADFEIVVRTPGFLIFSYSQPTLRI